MGPSPPGVTCPPSHGLARSWMARPTSSQERIGSVDALRGFAVFGILGANILAFGLAPEYRWWTALSDRVAERLVDALIASKFIILFSTLFGMSFALQMLRQESRGVHFPALFVRRQLGLLVIGVGHAVLLSGQDILIFYALLGFPLLLFRRRRPATVLVAAILFYAVSFIPVELQAMRGLARAPGVSGSEVATAQAGQSAPLTPSAEADRVTRIYRAGSFGEITGERVAEYLRQNPATSPLEYPRKFALFLVGLFIVRVGVFEDIRAHSRRIAAAAVVGLTLGLGGQLVLFFCHLPRAPAWTRAVVVPLYAIANPALSLGYGSMLLLLLQRAWLWKGLRYLGAAGRMALTNYVLQSIVCTTLFYRYGLALYGQLGPAVLLELSVAIFGSQVALSVAWMTRFRLGPLEWLWRSLTYGALQPMRAAHGSSHP